MKCRLNCIFDACVCLLFILQDLGKEQEEEDILIDLEGPPQFVLLANLPAFCQNIGRSATSTVEPDYCGIMKRKPGAVLHGL